MEACVRLVRLDPSKIVLAYPPWASRNSFRFTSVLRAISHNLRAGLSGWSHSKRFISVYDGIKRSIMSTSWAVAEIGGLASTKSIELRFSGTTIPHRIISFTHKRRIS